MLRARGRDVAAVEFGGAARQPAEYRNRRAELRKALEPDACVRGPARTPVATWARPLRCLSLPPDDARLREELAVLPRQFDGHGRLCLPPKTGRPYGG